MAEEKKRKDLFKFSILGLFLISIGIGFLIADKFFIKQKSYEKKTEKKKKEIKIGQVIDLDEMILTLLSKSGGETKYFKFQITLEVDEKSNINVEKFKHLLYDIIIKVGSKYYIEDLLTDFGKESFRNELKREFSNILGTENINVYFKKFIL